MEPDAFPEPSVEVPTVDAASLKSHIDAGEPVFVLDTRAADEFDEWHLDGPAVELLNVPYFELLDGVDEATLEALPDDREIVVVCAKGGASEYVAGLLAETGIEVTHLAGGMEAWAALYEVDPITRYDGAGAVYQYRRPSSGCLSYLVVDGDEAAVVDPLRAFADRYLEDAASMDVELRYALDTHVHADHVSGVRALAERDVEGVIPARAADRGVADADAFTLAADGNTFTVGDVEVAVRHAPGHTTGMTAYLVGGDALLTGDGLFVESVARPDLEAGDAGAPGAAAQLHETLQEVVLPLDDDVVVGGAHFSDAAEPADDGTYTATLGELREAMDALSMDREAFVELVLADMPPRPANYETIIETNLGREAKTDDEAFRLELGPNNCAASQAALTGD